MLSNINESMFIERKRKIVHFERTKIEKIPLFGSNLGPLGYEATHMTIRPKELVWRREREQHILK